jgi:hypothetical protein
MRGCLFFLVWALCVLAGAAIGFLIGYGIWKLGFELIGAAVAWVGAAVGGILVFLAVFNWYDQRSE